MELTSKEMAIARRVYKYVMQWWHDYEGYEDTASSEIDDLDLKAIALGYKTKNPWSDDGNN
jgi:hypothetical protein